jgi:hypothetical protein
MALIKVMDLAYGRLRSPDLDAAEEFLTHFGRRSRGGCEHGQMSVEHHALTADEHDGPMIDLDLAPGHSRRSWTRRALSGTSKI